MEFSEGYFLGVVVTAVVETHSQGNPLTILIEHRGGVQAAGKDEDGVFGCVHRIHRNSSSM